MGHGEQSYISAGASFPCWKAKAMFPSARFASVSNVGLGDGDQSQSSCPRSSLWALRIHRSRLTPLITTLMVPTRLLFLSRSDRGRQCAAFIFGTRGYLWRLCGLKGHALSLRDNRLFLLSSSKLKLIPLLILSWANNFFPPICVSEQSRDECASPFLFLLRFCSALLEEE